MRLFIAIKLPEEAKHSLQSLAQAMESVLPGEKGTLRWVKPDQFHLTLKFLGECGEESVERLKAALNPLGHRYAPFSLRLRGIGSFASRGFVRIIWMGIDQGAGTVERIVVDIEDTLQKEGFEKEGRVYHPHLTLARVKTPLPEIDLDKARSAVEKTVVGPFVASRVSLIQSLLASSGPQYTTLHEVPFQQDVGTLSAR